MLRFFRTLRRKLLEEDNVRKYFWYALGEVLLVVIGILIALQINNWNEGRVNELKKERYTQSMIEDLRRDTTTLSRYIQFNDQIFQQDSVQSERLSSDKANYDSLFLFVKDEFQIGQVNLGNFNTNTFQILTSTGDIDLFDEETIEQMYVLNEMQTNVINFGNQFYQMYVEETLVFMRKYPIASFAAMVQDGPILDDMWNKVNKEELAKDFHALSFIKRMHLGTMEGRYPFMLEQTTEMLQKLEEEN